MSRRRILNITSQKKQDSMVPASVTGAGVITALVNGATVLSSATSNLFLFSPTHRIQSSPGLSNNFSFNPSAQRTSQTTFARGIKETVRLTWDNGTSWWYRRIVFQLRQDPGIVAPTGYGPVSVAQISASAVPQTARVTMQNPTPGVVQALIFKGVPGTDWNDDITAPVDHQRNRVMYDRTFSMNCPSGTVTNRTFKFYHPLNKTIIYNDDENNTGIGQTGYSATSSSPLGDIYILDVFKSASNPGTAAQLLFTPECTYYWHER